MPLPELQPELWYCIFEFVKRDVPPPWKPATWSDFHQEDLASVCRVSSSFYDIAAPLLYTSIVAPSIQTLLQCLEEDDHVLPGSKRTKRKREFAATTKTLRLVGLGPSTTPVTKFASLLKNGNWKKIGISRKANDRRVRRSAMDELVQLTRREMGRTPFSPRRREDYFHSLEKLIIGQVYNYPCAWDYVDPDEDGRDLVAFAQNAVDSFIVANAPMRVCINASRGPYCVRALNYDLKPKRSTPFEAVLPGQPASHRNIDTPPVPVVTRHLYEYGRYHICPELAFGAINRWIALPASIMDSRRRPEHEWTQENELAESHLFDYLLNAIETWAGMERVTMSEEWKKTRSKTVLDFYGQSIGEDSDEYMLCQTTSKDNQGEVHEGTFDSPQQEEWYRETIAYAFEARAVLRSREAVMNKILTAKLLGDPTFPGWSGTVRFNRWRDTPACSCCGWNLETGRQMGTERMLRRNDQTELRGIQFTMMSPVVNASRETIPLRFPWDPDASLHRKLLEKWPRPEVIEDEARVVC